MSSWFISPWEAAARFSLEAQRLIALQFFPLAPRQEQGRQEVASDEEKPLATQQNIGSSADVAIPPRSRKNVQPRTAAVRHAPEVIRKATGSKTKGGKGKRKSNTKRKRG